MKMMINCNCKYLYQLYISKDINKNIRKEIFYYRVKLTFAQKSIKINFKVYSGEKLTLIDCTEQ